MNKKLIFILALIVLLLIIPIISKANDDNQLYSEKYTISQNYILRVEPKTTVKEFKHYFNVDETLLQIYQDDTCEQEVTGNIGTGMVLVYTNIQTEEKEKYTISVIGDLDRNSKIEPLELNTLIKYIADEKNNKLTELDCLSVDMNMDGKIDIIDITIMIRYIVSNRIEVQEIKSDGFIVQIQGIEEEKEISNITWHIREVKSQQYIEEKETVEGKIKPKEFTRLKQGTSYEIYAQIYDVKGNIIETERRLITTKNIKPLNKENTNISCTPTVWTNEKVIATIETTEEEGILEYSLDGENWSKYIGPIEIEKNGNIYARLTDGTNAGESIIKVINNVDMELPTIRSIQIQEKTSKKIIANLQVQDSLSGLKKIDWYYKKESDEDYTKIEQIEEGTTIEVNKTLELNALISGTYHIYADIYDVAGNVVRTQPIEVETEPIPSAEDAITILPNTTNWTNENLKVTLTNAAPEYIMQYSTDGNTWTEGTSVILSENGTIYGRLTDGINVGEVKSLTIENIDKVNPTIGEIVGKDITSKSFIAQISVQDSLSGVAKIDWYYKKSTDSDYIKVTQEEQDINGSQTGETLLTTKEISLDNLTSGTYNIYVDVYDVAGNKTTSNIKEINTKAIEGLVEGENISLIQTPTDWTKDNVKVNIETTITDYTIKYSMDGNMWHEYTRRNTSNRRQLNNICMPNRRSKYRRNNKF